MSVLTLSSENFRKELMDSKCLFLVDFWADWCGPCRAMAPVVEALAKERPDLKVGKVNVDEEVELADQFGIMSIPTLILFDGDKMLRRFVGLTSKDDLLQAIDLILQH